MNIFYQNSLKAECHVGEEMPWSPLWDTFTIPVRNCWKYQVNNGIHGIRVQKPDMLNMVTVFEVKGMIDENY